LATPPSLFPEGFDFPAVYRLGEDAPMGDTHIRVLGTQAAHEMYRADGSSYCASEGRFYYIIDFEVLTAREPHGGAYWLPEAFIKSVVEADGTVHGWPGSVPEDNRINPHRHTQAQVYFSLPRGTEIVEIILSDGATRDMAVVVAR